MTRRTGSCHDFNANPGPDKWFSIRCASRCRAACNWRRTRASCCWSGWQRPKWTRRSTHGCAISCCISSCSSRCWRSCSGPAANCGRRNAAARHDDAGPGDLCLWRVAGGLGAMGWREIAAVWLTTRQGPVGLARFYLYGRILRQLRETFTGPDGRNTAIGALLLQALRLIDAPRAWDGVAYRLADRLAPRLAQHAPRGCSACSRRWRSRGFITASSCSPT